MKVKLLISGLIAVVAAAAVAATDPVVMTINGKDVKLSEFEYLYKKNSAQQVEPESLDQYVDRFVTYKLKVADAEAMGLDTLPEIMRELDGYRADIIAPYLNDTTVREQLALEAYDRMKRNVDISHIMISRGRDEAQDAYQIEFLDSIRNLIVNGQLDFNAAADEYSIDRSVKTNHGNYGYISSGLFPYAFDKVAFSTPIGQLSQPFKTDFGIHLIRVNDEIENAGTVEAEHILLMVPRGIEDPVEASAAKAAVKVRIDSIYQALINGADFEEMARRFSEDKGSAQNGGKLLPFGRGRMVRPFETTAFNMGVGEISEPVETAYGYHIIKKLAQYPVKSYDEARKGILNAMAMDERANAGRKAMTERLRGEYKVAVNRSLSREILKLLNENGGYSNDFVTNVLSQSNITAYSYAPQGKKKVKVPISTIVPLLNGKAQFNNEAGAKYIASRVDDLIESDLLAIYSRDIIENNPEYKNLLGEYRDGTLLYEISRRRVFDVPANDYDALNAYFLANKDKYNVWDTLHFKGVICYAVNDSAADVAKQIKASMIGQPVDTIAARIHKELGNKVLMERRLADFRENSNVDYLVFNGTNPRSNHNDYPVFFILDGKVLDQPEEASDLRGPVSSDYQLYLEQQWVEELHKKYPVEVNHDVLKRV